MKFMAQCHLCPTKVDVPSEHVFLADAKKWASAWEDEHIKEAHSDNTEQATS